MESFSLPSAISSLDVSPEPSAGSAWSLLVLADALSVFAVSMSYLQTLRLLFLRDTPPPESILCLNCLVNEVWK